MTSKQIKKLVAGVAITLFASVVIGFLALGAYVGITARWSCDAWITEQGLVKIQVHRQCAGVTEDNTLIVKE